MLLLTFLYLLTVCLTNYVPFNSFSIMPNKTIVKTPEQVIADHFGYCTLEMLRGNCKTVAEDPLQDLICDDGLPHSDLALLKKTQFDASVQALVDMRFRPRVVQSSESVVGTRHISLSEAFNACKSAATALDNAISDAKEQLSKSSETASSDDGNHNKSNETATSNDGNVNNES